MTTAAAAQGRRVTAQDIILLVEQDRLTQAETLLRYQLSHSATPLANYLLGHVLVQQFRFDEAEPLLRLALSARPERVAWRYDLARTLLGQGRCTAAIGELDTCIAADPAPGYRYDKAMCALNIGDLAMAEAELVAALDTGWESAQAWSKLGQLHADRGADAAARGAYERTLALQPDHLEATYALGVIESRAGNDERAVALFRRVLERVPGHVGAAYNLGRSLGRAGHAAEGRAALLDFRRLSKIEDLIENHRVYLTHFPDNVDTRLALGALLLEAGRPSEATAVLEQALRLEPARDEIYRLLADSYRLEGREAEAARAAGRPARQSS